MAAIRLLHLVEVGDVAARIQQRRNGNDVGGAALDVAAHGAVIRQLVADAVGARAALVDAQQRLGVLHHIRAEQIPRDVVAELNGDHPALDALALEQAHVLIIRDAPLLFRPGERQAVEHVELVVDLAAHVLHQVFDAPLFLFGLLRRGRLPLIDGIAQQPRVGDQRNLHLRLNPRGFLRAVVVVLRQVERRGGEQLLRADRQADFQPVVALKKRAEALVLDDRVASDRVNGHVPRRRHRQTAGRLALHHGIIRVVAAEQIDAVYDRLDRLRRLDNQAGDGAADGFQVFRFKNLFLFRHVVLLSAAGCPAGGCRPWGTCSPLQESRARRPACRASRRSRPDRTAPRGGRIIRPA